MYEITTIMFTVLPPDPVCEPLATHPGSSPSFLFRHIFECGDLASSTIQKSSSNVVCTSRANLTLFARSTELKMPFLLASQNFYPIRFKALLNVISDTCCSPYCALSRWHEKLPSILRSFPMFLRITLSSHEYTLRGLPDGFPFSLISLGF